MSGNPKAVARVIAGDTHASEENAEITIDVRRCQGQTVLPAEEGARGGTAASDLTQERLNGVGICEGATNVNETADMGGVRFG